MKVTEVNPKPLYVPLHRQPEYRVAQILLILFCNTGRGKSASISFLQTISWAMRDVQNMQILIDFKEGKRKGLVPWCFEPAMDKALIITLINGYCDRLTGGKIKLTKKGRGIVEIINKENLFKKMNGQLRELGDLTNKDFTKQTWELL